MPLDPLTAEVQLLTKGFRTELNKIVADLKATSAEVAKIGSGAGRGFEATAAGARRASGELRQINRQLIDVEKTGRSIGESFGSFFGRIALFSVAAGVIVRSFFALQQAIKDVVKSGIEFNSGLEQNRLALGAILTSTRNLQTAQGAVATAAQAYPVFLQKASGFQRELLTRSIETLGTFEELRDVFARTLAFSAQQNATDQDRLQLAQNILNAGKLLGLTGEQLTVETRQILTLEQNRGQTLLQSLGLTVQQLRVFKEQGTLVQELNTRFSAFALLAKDAALTFDGLTSTAKTFLNVIAGGVSEDAFRGLKDILIGFNAELRKVDAAGGLFVALGVGKEQLRALGADFASFAISLTKGTFGALNAIIELASELRGLGSLIGGLVAAAFSALRGALDGLLVPVRGLSSLIDLLSFGLLNLSGAFSDSASSAQTWAGILADINSALGALLKGGALGVLLGLTGGFLAAGPFGAGFGAVAGGLLGIPIAGIIKGFQDLQKAADELALGESVDEEITQVLSVLGKLNNGLPKSQDELNAFIQTANKLQTALEQTRERIKSEITDPVTKAARLGDIATLENLLGRLFLTLEKGKKGDAKTNEDFVRAQQAAAAAVDALADANLRLAKTRAELFGDVGQFRSAAIAEIGAQLAKELAGLEKIKDANLKAQAAAAFRAKAVVAGEEAAIRAIQFSIKEEEKRQKIVEDAIKLEADFARARLAASDIRLGSQADQIQEELAALKEKSGTLGEQIRLVQKLAQIEQDQLTTARDLVQENLRELEKQLVLGKAAIEDARALLKIEEDAKNADGIKLRTDQLREQEKAYDRLTVQQPELRAKAEAAQAAIGIGAQRSAREIKSLTTVTVNLGDTLLQSFNQVIDAIIEGTLDAGNAVKSFGISIAKSIVGGFLEAQKAKFGFDLLFKKNLGGLGQSVTDLGGTIASLFGFGGGLSNIAGAGQGGFITNFGQGFQQTVQQSATFAQTTFTSAGQQSGLGFAQGFLRNLGAGFAGFGAGELVRNLFGIGQGPSGNLGAKAGAIVGGTIGAIFFGPLGAGVGAFLGDLFGGFIGGLFDSLPTKGTQIRQGVVKFLQGIDVAFADELDADRYGFEWIERFRKQTGQNFLEASKEFIPQNFSQLVAQNLDKELLAIGVVTTAKQAAKLKKDLNQTAISFTNLVAENLGGDIEKISTFINSFVEKTGANLATFVDVLNKEFQAGRLDVDNYRRAIEGTVRIFTKDLPLAIDAVKLANESFVDGVFQIDVFQKKVEGAVAAFALLGETAIDALSSGLAQGLSGADIAKNFKQQVEGKLRDAIVAGFITGFLKAALSTAAIAEPLAKITQLITDFISGAIGKDAFKDGLRTAIEAARPEIERFVDLVGESADEITAFLDDVGLLPEQAAQSFSFLGGNIREIIRSGITDGLSAREIFDNARASIIENIANAIIDGFIEGFLRSSLTMGALKTALEPISQAIDDFVSGKITETEFENIVAGGFEKAIPFIERFAAAIGVSSETLRRFLQTAGLLPETLSSLGPLAEAFLAPFENIGKGALNDLFAYEQKLQQIEKDFRSGKIGTFAAGGFYDQLENLGPPPPSLGQALREQIADSVLTGIREAIIQAAIEEAILIPFKETLTRFVKDAFSDGKLSTEELQQISALGRQAANDAEEAAAQIAPALLDAQDVSDSIRDDFELGADAVGALDFSNLLSQSDRIRRNFEEIANLPPITVSGAGGAGQQRGGPVSGPAGIDAVPIMATAGEFIVRNGPSQAFRPFLEDINSGQIARMQGGGMIPQSHQPRHPFPEPLPTPPAPLLPTPGDPRAPGLPSISAEDLDRILESVRNFIGDTGSAVAQLRAEFATLETALSGSREALEARGHDVTGLIDDLAEALDTKLKEAVTRSLDAVRGFVGTSQGLGDQIEAIGLEAAQLVENLPPPEDLALIGESIGGLTTQIERARQARIDTLIQDLLNPIRDFISQTISPTQALREQFSELQLSLLNNRPALEAAGEDINQLLIDLGNTLDEQLRDAVRDAISGVQNFIGNGDSLAGLIADISEEAKDLTESLPSPSDLAGIGENFYDLRDQIEQARQENVADAIQDFLSPVLNFIGEAADPARKIREEFAALQRQLISNRPALEAAGRNVDELLGQLSESLDERLAEAVEEANRSIIALVKSLRKSSEDLLLSETSPLLSAERLSVAQNAFNVAAQAALGGDEEAAGQLASLAQTFIREAQDTFASSQPFLDIFAAVRATLEAVAARFESQIPSFASGGLITSPTLARVGEVPEAILPLAALRSKGFAPVSSGGGFDIAPVTSPVTTTYFSNRDPDFSTLAAAIADGLSGQSDGSGQPIVIPIEIITPTRESLYRYTIRRMGDEGAKRKILIDADAVGRRRDF